jgi:hypothetical protein
MRKAIRKLTDAAFVQDLRGEQQKTAAHLHMKAGDEPGIASLKVC